MAGFMAGFGTTMSNLIEEDRKYYRESAAKRRDYLQTYGTKAVVDREEKANAALGTVNSLITSGIPEEDVRYVLDTSGVQGIAQLQATIKSRTDLSAEERQSLVKKAKDYVADNPDEDINTVIKRAYGLYKSTDKPVERERNLMSSILGLDARMMEDEVLDDMYVNGMTGRDIYRIMGSSGPKAGDPLSLNLPAKAPSAQILAAGAKTLLGKFESSIDGRINAAIRANDPALREELEALKARGVDGIAEYATSYDPALFDFAANLENEYPGVVTRNSINLGGFTSAFGSYVGDAQDDARLDAAAGREEDGTTPPVVGKVTTTASPTAKTLTFETPAEFNAAVTEGKVVPGDKVIIAGAAAQTYMPPEEGVPTGMLDVKGGFEPIAGMITSTLDGKDGKVEDYNELYDNLMALPEDQRSAYSKEYQKLQEVPALTEIVAEIAEDVPGLTDKVTGKAVGGAMWAFGAFTQGVAQVGNFITGNTAKATRLTLKGEETKEAAKEVMANGIVEHLQERADAAGVTGAFGPGRAERIKEALKESNVLDPTIQEITEREERIRDDSRQFRADDRSYPQPLDTLVTNAPKDFVDTVRANMESQESPVESLANLVGGDADEVQEEPTGLMSRKRPKVRPLKLGQPEFMDLIETLHGSGSSVVANWKEKTSSSDTKLKVSDVTRLIKDTQALPKTKGRSKLLESLYDLRDVMNNRK